MRRQHFHKTDEEPIGVLFIGSPHRDHSHVIKNALEKARGEGKIGVVACLDGCDGGCEERIEQIMERHRIDLVVAPHSAYQRLERMRLGHLFVDAEAMLFGGEDPAEIFSASPGRFGIAGTRGIDAGLPTAAAELVQNPMGKLGGSSGGGRSAAMGILLGRGGAQMNFRDLLGAGQGAPRGHLGGAVAGGSTESVRIGGNTYEVSMTSNEYGGHDYFSEDGWSAKTDSKGNVREYTDHANWGDRVISQTTKYDAAGRVVEVHRYVIYFEDAEPETEEAPEQETKPSGQEPDDAGKDFRLVVREFVEKMLLEELWVGMLTGTMRPERTDVTQEFRVWLMQQNVNDFCHSFEAEFKEKDETGYAFAYWVSQAVGSSSVRASKVWEYLWNKGAPVDPIGGAAYRSRVSSVGGRVDPDTGELLLDLHGVGDTH